MKINKIRPQRVSLYNPNGVKIGTVNEYELNDFLIQVKNSNEEGYYCTFKKEKLPILKGGKIMRPPIGFFDLSMEQMDKLMGI